MADGFQPRFYSGRGARGSNSGSRGSNPGASGYSRGASGPRPSRGSTWQDRGGRGRGDGTRHGSHSGSRGGGQSRGKGLHTESGRGGHQQRVLSENVTTMSPQIMQALMMASATDALLAVVNPRSGFEKALQSTSSHGSLVETILLLLEKIGTVQGMPGNLSRILHHVITSGFVTSSLIPYLCQMRIERNVDCKSECLYAVFSIMELLLSHIPAASADQVTTILSQMSGFLNVTRDVYIKEQIQDRIKHVESLQDDIVKQIQGGSLRKEQSDVQEEDVEPPNNFRQVSVVPTTQDLSENVEIFLRKNKITGCYKDAEQYLDIQFRLLREDYMMPLRQGIREIIRSGDKKVNEKYVQDVRIYTNVRNHGAWYSNKGVVYRIEFDVSSLRQVKWEISHRLIFGSLVCLSSDNFKTITVRIVSERDPKLLRRGLIDVLINDSQNLDPSPFVRYKMVECSAYFEAYKYNLEGLQDLTEQSLPFKRYLLNQEADACIAPRYLRGHDTEYNFEPLLQKKTPLNRMKSRRIRVLDRENWPKAIELGLDDSQYRAVQMAIIREFSIIQGPPGTGKTFIGLKIVQLLLLNFDKWGRAFDQQMERVTNPILIVCYTNHALDQFLEGILKFTDNDDGDIVRVGSRSSSENPALQRCLLSKLKRDDELRKMIPRELRENKSAVTEQMKSQEAYLSEIGQMMTWVTTQIIPEAMLLHMMAPYHRQTFESMKNTNISQMTNWLLSGDQEPHKRKAESNEENWDDGTEDVHLDDDETGDFNDDDEAVTLENERRAQMSDDEEQEQLGQKSKRMLDSTGLRMPDVPGSSHSHKQQGRWHKVVSQKKMKRIIKLELGKRDCMTEQEEALIGNIWQLNFQQRWRLYRLWTSRLCMDCTLRMQNGMTEFNQLARQLHEYRDEEDWHFLRRGRVIAMTTTGAAKYRHILRRIQPRIVIVEEAAEVLEAHIVTSLSENCQHLVLIGDHQQLRPNPTVYKLAKDYHLDISLFERMLRNNMHCESLTVQHRMRPEIAKLIVPHIYKQLLNHESVEQYEDVPGIGGNVYFVTHSQFESQAFDSKSHSNTHEANYVTALCKYILQQGFTPDQITILTTYRGQMYELKKRTRNNPMMAEVRVTPVDNYQGEENEVILLSLVRSNEEGRVGFIKIANRICVALSRAKKGFFVIGNMEIIRDTSAVWRNILKHLEADGKLVTGIPLVCQNHPEMRIDAISADDFAKAPEGGCTKPCEARLRCGHVCSLKCHPTDKDHRKYQCTKPCIKDICIYGHDCPKRCCDDCGDCMFPMEKDIPKCGHKQMVPCSVTVQTFKCQVPCDMTMTCSHQCPRACSDKCLPREECAVIVPDRLWPCGHKHDVECYKNSINFPCPTPTVQILPCGHVAEMICSTDIQSFDCKEIVQIELCSRKCQNKVACYMSEKIRTTGCQVVLDVSCSKNPQHRYKAKCAEYDTKPCPVQCDYELQCGHLCEGTCGDCSTKDGHKVCTSPCQRQLPCLHPCQAKCGEVCSPCSAKCTKICPHGVCPNLCGEACSKCNAPCAWSCQHVKCRRTCGEACTREPCDRPCPGRISRCGHQCPGYCGEPCPAICPVCQGSFFQQMRTALAIKPIKTDRYVVLHPCNHVIPTRFMDDVLRKVRDQLRTKHEFRPLCCPMCRVAVRYCPRYQREITRLQSEFDEVKSVSKASHAIVSKLNMFSDAPELVAHLGILAEHGEDGENNDKYARQCLGCLSILGESALVIRKVKQAKDNPGKSVITALDKSLDGYKTAVHDLILDDVDQAGIRRLTCQLSLYFIECHTRHLITYVKNTQKRDTLMHIASTIPSVRLAESLDTMKTRLRTYCATLQNTIPPGLRRGLDNYGQTIKQFYQGQVYLHTESKWVICSQSHTFAVSKDTEIAAALCPKCNQGLEPDSQSDDEDGAGINPFALRHRRLNQVFDALQLQRRRRLEHGAVRLDRNAGGAERRPVRLARADSDSDRDDEQRDIHVEAQYLQLQRRRRLERDAFRLGRNVGVAERRQVMLARADSDSDRDDELRDIEEQYQQFYDDLY